MQNPADPPFPPAGPAFDEARVLDALWQVVATRGWHDVTFARIAAESGVGLDSLRSRYGTPMALLAAHARAVDRQVLSTTIPGDLLNWAMAQQGLGRQVSFRQVHRLVAAFFGVVGITEAARVVLRSD